MIDIKFYQKTYNIKKLLQEGKITRDTVYHCFEAYRQKEPVVFNIETSNICNMECAMCPRTTQMTRKVGTMSTELFEEIVQELKPWSGEEWNQWKLFVKKNYKVEENEMNENHFFFYIVPKVITLHGYGEPLLDKHIVERIKCLFDNEIPSYFSCNPYNITFSKGKKLIEEGINYFKLSADDIKLFKKAELIIKRLILLCESYDTKIILDVVGKPEEYEELMMLFEGYDAYMYLKSQDQQWYKQSDDLQHSIHWLEPCQFPWSSMSIMWDGSVVPCGQDYNNEMVLGDANKQSLYDIWNGAKYNQFRKNHLTKQNKNKYKCYARCDMQLVGDF